MYIFGNEDPNHVHFRDYPYFGTYFCSCSYDIRTRYFDPLVQLVTPLWERRCAVGSGGDDPDKFEE